MRDGQMFKAKIPDDVFTEGRTINATCRVAGCSGIIKTINYDQWNEICTNDHDLPLPNKFIGGDAVIRQYQGPDIPIDWSDA